MNELPPYDELVRLAEEDPEGLERLRVNLVREIIESAPKDSQLKLKGLQFKIDMIKRKAKNPLQATIEISKIMQDSFLELRDSLKEAQGLLTIMKQGGIIDTQETSENTPVNSNVLTFTPKSGDTDEI